MNGQQQAIAQYIEYEITHEDQALWPQREAFARQQAERAAEQKRKEESTDEH